MTNPKAGQPEFQPDAEMFVCMDPTGCYHVSWNAEQHKAKMAQVGAAHGARYVRAGQPYMVEQRARIEELAEKLVQPSGDDFTDLRVRDAAAEEILSLQSQLEAAEKAKAEAIELASSISLKYAAAAEIVAAKSDAKLTAEAERDAMREALDHAERYATSLGATRDHPLRVTIRKALQPQEASQ